MLDFAAMTLYVSPVLLGGVMKIHEYQAKALLREAGVSCPEGHAATSLAGMEALDGKLADGVWVVKAQVHAGGRGKGIAYRDGTEVGRGVQVKRSPGEALAAAKSLLGATLVTVQTGKKGKRIGRVLIERGVEIATELYLAFIVDRDNSRVALIGSSEGGTEIEEVARKSPEKIHTVGIDPLVGLKEYHARDMAIRLGIPVGSLPGFVSLATKLYGVFASKDCSLAEVNPLVITKSGAVIALDAKLGFDDNGLFRHPEVVALRDLDEEEPSEVEAADAKLNYIKLDGDIGCLVNGAGLAMATMDAVKECGGEPANFLDVGGTATADNVALSFRIMLRDKVKGIFVNVFGGIVRCDVVAQGLVEALSKVKLDIPLVVRLAGNRKDEAVAILAGSGLPIITADDMKDGAEKIVRACGGTR